MSNRREKFSGAQYKKLAKERLEKQEKVLSKMLKLDCFFFSRNLPTTSADNSTETSDNSESTLLSSNGTNIILNF